MTLVRRVVHLEGRLVVAQQQAAVEPVPLDGPADVLAVLVEQVNAVRADHLADPAERARTLGFLAGVALRAMEAKDLAARLEAVERVLRLRKDEQHQLQHQDAKRRR